MNKTKKKVLTSNNLSDNELDQKTINKIKEELIARKKQILEDLEDIASKEEGNNDERRAKFPDFGNKSDENAQEISEYSTNLATEKVLETSLRDINNTLKRIENGTYGICKYCSQPIGKKRMLARTVASACIDCKTKLQSS
ncbi:MAG: TraR/DksA family transcriptional regulator [Patescibacteria group bacterium]